MKIKISNGQTLDGVKDVTFTTTGVAWNGQKETVKDVANADIKSIYYDNGKIDTPYPVVRLIERID